MSNRTIPLLIGAMILALIGIIVIQYKWIEQSLDEKRTLINHKVHQMVANVDKRLSVYNSLAFISGLPDADSLFEKNIHAEYNSICDTTYEQDSIFYSCFQDFSGSRSFESNGEMEVHVFREDSLNYSETRTYSDSNHVEWLKESIEDEKEAIKVKLKEVNSVLERIEIEISDDMDGRLDSTVFSEKLSDEAKTLGLIPPANWAVYDHLSKNFVIHPEKDQKWDYKLPLFKEDIIHPGRYRLYLSMADSNEVIWRQILVMILLSLVFIAIIVFVFIYSIRLVIKHKKISAIKSDFINNMTHEFKTPLASISLAADSILHPKVALDEDKVRSYIDIIKAEKNKLNRHIETILEVASLKENDVPLPLTKIDLNSCIEDAIKKLGLLIEDRKCSIQLNLIPDVYVMANYYQLENVFSNLIENSIKYSEGAPEVVISTEMQENDIVLTIKDSGIGMTKEQIKKAFDHFYRAQKGNIHNTKGFGLGLSFVKYMIDKMNSTIRIESKLNEGTSVIINFQRYQ